MAIEDELKAKRNEIRSEFEDVEGGVMWVAIFFCIFALVFGLMGVMLSPVGQALGLMESEPGTGIGVGVLVVAALVAVILPLIFVERWMEAYWRRHYRDAWRWLRHTQLAQFVIDETYWEQVFAVLERHPWMKLSGTRRPASLDEQIELASDYQYALRLLVRGRTRRLTWAVWWGSATRLADDLAVYCLGSCGTLGCLIAGSWLFFTVGLPLWLPWLGLYVRRQAWQTALIDYFLEDPQVATGRLKPPRGM